MNKYIVGFNNPFLKYQSGNIIRIINVDEILHIKYWEGGRAFIVFKNGSDEEISIEGAKAIGDFLMTLKVTKTQQPVISRRILMDVEMVHDEQTLLEWLEENGQA